jgi:hypothetical protein
VPEILQHLFQPDEGTLVAMEFLGLLDTTVDSSRYSPGLFRSHTAALKIILKQRQMRNNFPRQISLRASTEKEVFELGEETSYDSHKSLSTSPAIRRQR